MATVLKRSIELPERNELRSFRRKLLDEPKRSAGQLPHRRERNSEGDRPSNEPFYAQLLSNPSTVAKPTETDHYFSDSA
jgi:hypothetical protein